MSGTPFPDALYSIKFWLTLENIKCILGTNKAHRGNKMKANINVPEEVLAKTDKKAKSLGISRSAFITMTLSEKLMQTDLMDSLPQMLETLKNFKENEKQ